MISSYGLNMASYGLHIALPPCTEPEGQPEVKTQSLFRSFEQESSPRQVCIYMAFQISIIHGNCFQSLYSSRYLPSPVSSPQAIVHLTICSFPQAAVATHLPLNTFNNCHPLNLWGNRQLKPEQALELKLPPSRSTHTTTVPRIKSSLLPVVPATSPRNVGSVFRSNLPAGKQEDSEQGQ